MDINVKEKWQEYDHNWQMLYDLFENIPEDKLDWKISEGNRTLKELLAHIAGVEKCYLEVVKTGADGWIYCHKEEEDAKKPKQDLMKLYRDSHDEFKKELEDRDPTEQIDWTEGDFLSLTEHIEDIIKQSLFHQGQLVVYVRELGELYFPHSWGVWGY